jgi:glycosyltransferase involved in cell wall biosynthesis
MNIGFDAKRAFFNRSGLGNYSRSTLMLLSRFYPENSYYLFSPESSSALFQPSGNQIMVQPDSGFSRFFPSLWRSWGKYLRNHRKLDIYHGLSNELPWSIKNTGIKSVVTIHDLIFIRYPEYYPVIDRQIYFYKSRHACRIADKIIAISEATKQDIITFFETEPEKIVVKYQTCDPVFRTAVSTVKKEEIRKKYNLPEQFILCVGTIEKRKNTLSLVKACISQSIDIPLVIAGKPTEYLSQIKAFLKNIPDAGRIIFLHNVESADLPALYQSAILFAYPSVFEGFGIPILEAMYSGVPVISSTGSCFTETGGDAALYCDPYDIENMGKSISKILNDPLLRKSMIEKGYIQSRKFDEKAVAANLMTVYLNL